MTGPAPGATEPATDGRPPEPAPLAALGEVARLFLRLGFTAFGGPAAHVAMMREEVVRRRGWVSEARFLDLIGITNLIPGPNSTELAIYLGYLRAGWPGLIVAGLCFIGPAMAIVLALAWAYVTYGGLPQVAWLFYGIQPVVVAIVVYALWGLGRPVLGRPWPLAVAALVLVLELAGLNPLILLFGGGLLIAAPRWVRPGGPGRSAPAALLAPALSALRAGRAKLAGIAAGVVGVAAAPFSLGTLFLTFLKIGAVLYGSGYVLLAFLRADFVQGLGWLSDRQLLDAVSIGQFTPGPVFTTATFIGYLVGGWPGALLQLGRAALVDPLTAVLILVAFTVLLRYKINSVWLILAGAALGVLRFWAFPG